MVLPALLLALAALAADDSDKPKDFVAYPDRSAVTTHTIEIAGMPIHFEATAGSLAMVDDKRQTTGRMFYVAYRRLPNDPAGAPADAPNAYPPEMRPITFCFNGGPGSSSVWLHLGLFGPWRVPYADELGNPGAPPYRPVPNNDSLLPVTDLVFIDPISTGYSRPEGDTPAANFHGVEADINSVAEFVRRFLTREKRWGSPKYVAGESYGTTRAAGLAEALWSRSGVALNGVILISMVTDFQTIRFDASNDLPYLLYLPSYAAVAWHHTALPAAEQARPIDAVLADAEAFVRGPYAAALFQGDALAPAERDAVLDGLVRFTGLSREFIERSRLRIGQDAFCKELLRERGLTVGRLDARFTGIDRSSAGDSTEYDPSYAAIRGSYTACLNAIVRETLRFESDLPYEILGGIGGWSYQPAGDNRYLNVAERLRRAMHQQPDLRVFIAEGVTDLATPYYAAEHTISHMALAPERRTNVTPFRFNAGHMMYIDARERARLAALLRDFYAEAGRQP